ncbi:MAG TPA: lysophospholipid acyltransferase family protein [Saprospiraceae bacterium]|nr:lysophospholipid acyltransferase family protein [Saprospiraceae bacterium]
MPILTESDISRSLHLQKFGAAGTSLTKAMMRLLRIDQLNLMYDKHCHLEGLAFVDAILSALNITVDISDVDLKRLPKSGPFIVVSNHPLGGIDGLIMLKIMLTYHPESKIMANYLLEMIEPLKPYICAVNPFETNKNTKSSLSGIRQAFSHLDKSLPLGIFPAGEVSTLQNKMVWQIEDKPWDISAIKFIKKAKVPVIPMYFHARNSDLFYVVSAMNQYLRTAKLPSEVFNSAHKKITVRIGKAIPVSYQSNITDISIYSDIIRAKCYHLGHVFRRKKVFDIKKLHVKRKVVPILPGTSGLSLIREVEELRLTNKSVFENDMYELFFTKLDYAPAIKTEIGRLREISFREVGEGTGLALDLDKYDKYYHHLILLDKGNGQIAGAYRIGMGREIMAEHGMNGFYLSSLFYMSGPMRNFFNNAIEIGRAFVTKEYQQRPMPLFLLWKGICAVTKLHPEYKYIIGAASISSHYSPFSRSLLVQYLTKYHFDNELALYVAPKRAFNGIMKLKVAEILNDPSHQCVKAIDQLIEDVEPNGLKMPILIKKYLMQSARLLSFNVDADFNDAIDGLMYIEINNINLEKLS